MALEHGFRALRHRNYRLFLAGQFISLIGTWMQSVALGWLLYRLTHSPFLLGLAGFLGQIPSLFVSPVAGVYADRWNRRSMVIGAQALAMVQALLLATLVLTHTATVFELLGLTLFLGLINAVDVPARQSFLIEMVNSSDDLANAIALNSTVFNIARLVGPSIAGLLIGLIGEGTVFLLNGLSYIAVIGALLAIHVSPRPRSAQAPAPIWENLVEGIHYVAHFGPIRTILLMLGLVCLLGAPFTTLMPMFVTDVLHGRAHTLGLLVGSIGVGALVGALFLAHRRSVRGLGRVISIAAALFGGGLMAFSFVRTEWLASLLLTVIGFGMMAQMASSNTLLQTLVDPDKRGRVMSFYAVAFMGTTPVGCLIMGALAGRIGAPWTIFLGGTLCITAAGVFWRALPSLREQTRPIYERLGITKSDLAGSTLH